jgi:hypothetical protein
LIRRSRPQIQQHIRRAALESINVTITQHASVRMRERAITNAMLFDVLRRGLLNREPEPDLRHSGLTCLMERYIAGVNFGVLVNIDFPAVGIIVITVFEVS